MRLLLIVFLLAASTAPGLAGQNPDVRILLEFQNGSNYVAPAAFQTFTVTIYLDNFGPGGGVSAAALGLDRTFGGVLTTAEVLHGGIAIGGPESDWLLAWPGCLYPDGGGRVDIARVSYLYTGTPGSLSLVPTASDSTVVQDCNSGIDHWCVRLQPSGNGGVWMLPPVGNCPTPRTWHVPSEAPHIQAGIDSSASGDTVVLANGVFVGVGNRDINLQGKAIVVRSEGADPTLCEIDCGGNDLEWHRGFVVASGEGRGTVIEGVTIKNAYVEYPPEMGGGIYLNGSSPTIRNCVLKQGEANASFGGGVFCDNASPLIQDCVFVGNSAWGGGAVFCMQAGSSPEIDGCVFDGNSAIHGGGAIEAHFNSSPIITNCTFVRGAASGDGGGALISRYSSAPQISACILSFGSQGVPIVCDGGSVSIACTDIFGNPEGDWVGCIEGMQGIDGNISADPIFCDALNGDLTLNATSPCLNAPGCGRLGALGQGCDIAAGVIAADPAVQEWPFLSWIAPSPFNATTTIRFRVPKATDLSLSLYDVSGRCIITLVQDRHGAGEFASVWDGRDESGREVAPGVYIARLRAGDFAATRKMVLLR